MELTTIFILIIVLVFLMKNEKGKKIVHHFSNAAVHVAASADKATAALERQCDELLMSDEEAEALKAEVRASMAEEAEAKPKAKASKKAKTVADDFSDAI